MFDKEKAEVIKKMNAALGMSHRTKPYDVKNPADLEHALLLAVSAYRDYRHYYFELMEIDEQWDESLEYYDLASWFFSAVDAEKMDVLACEAVSAMDNVLDAFNNLSDRAEEHLAMILKAILCASSDVQMKVLGYAYEVEQEDMDARIVELIEKYDETDYCYNMEENRDNLLTVMWEKWGALEQNRKQEMENE